MIDLSQIECPECGETKLKSIHQTPEEIAAYCDGCSNNWIITVKLTVISSGQEESDDEPSIDPEINPMPF